MRQVLASAAVAAVLLFANRPAEACSLGINNCGLNQVSPAAGTSLPANVPGFVLEGGYADGDKASHVVDARLVSGNTIIPLAVTESDTSVPRADLVLATAPPPGDYTLEAHISRYGCNLPGGDPDAGADVPVVFDMTSAVTLTAPAPLPTTLGTVTPTAVPPEYTPVESQEQLAYTATLSPEMSAFASVATFSFEVDGKELPPAAAGQLPTYLLTLWCGPANEGVSGGTCGEPYAQATTPGQHALRMLARLPGATTPIATDATPVTMACNNVIMLPGDQQAPPSSGGGCNATGSREPLTALGTLLGLGLILARRRKRSNILP